MFKFLKEKIKKWTQKVVKTPSPAEPEKRRTPKKEKTLETPVKFNAGVGKYEPDTEKIEDIVEELKKEEEPKKEPEKKQGLISKIKQKVSSTTINEEAFEKYSEELEMLLIENNVALEVVDNIIADLKENVVGKEISKKEIEKNINESIKKTVEDVLIEPFDPIEEIQREKEPYVILFCGINGSGKTTTIAKFAHKLKKKKLSCVLAAADTFRAASIEQLKTHAEKLNVPVIAHEYQSDPAAVGFDAIKYAKKNNIDAVLIDTAGRMYTDKNLMQEIQKITKVCKPNLKIFVGESIAGNDSTEQAKAFNEAVDINAIILSKADIDEKGGTALSVGKVTNKPIIYLGTGQEYDKLEAFDKKKFIEKLF
jgi:fused signal recognition particle receptor